MPWKLPLIEQISQAFCQVYKSEIDNVNKESEARLTTRVQAMPCDTNPAGDMFGGWVLSQMDIAAGICASRRAQCRDVTVSLEAMSFIRSVRVGNILGVYTKAASVC